VLLSTIRIPSGVSGALAGNVSMVGVGNTDVDSVSIILYHGDGVGRGLSSIAGDNLVRWEAHPGEVGHTVFLSSIWVPGLVSLGLGRDVTLWGVGDSDVEVASTIVLVTSWDGTRSIWVLFGVEESVRLYNPGEVVGLVFLSVIRIPGFASLSLSGDIAVVGVGKGSVQGTSSVILVSTTNSTRWD